MARMTDDRRRKLQALVQVCTAEEIVDKWNYDPDDAALAQMEALYGPFKRAMEMSESERLTTARQLEKVRKALSTIWWRLTWSAVPVIPTRQAAAEALEITNRKARGWLRCWMRDLEAMMVPPELRPDGEEPKFSDREACTLEWLACPDEDFSPDPVPDLPTPEERSLPWGFDGWTPD